MRFEGGQQGLDSPERSSTAQRAVLPDGHRNSGVMMLVTNRDGIRYHKDLGRPWRSNEGDWVGWEGVDKRYQLC